MAAADRKRWDALHNALAKEREKLYEFERALRSKYGSSYQDSWLNRGQRDKLDRLRDRVEAVRDKIIALIVAVSPRGDRWLTGVPSHWLTDSLTWEDVIRPANEQLSVVVPGAWGYRDGHMQANKRRRVAMARVADFSDEDAVLAEMAKELDIDPDELEIDDDGGGLSNFDAGTVYEITIRGGSGRKEWQVVENDDAMRELALAVVKQDLEQEPGLFSKDFIAQHINTDRLRRDLEQDLLNSRIDDLTYEAERNPDRFWEDYEREGFDAPEEDEEGERREPESDEIEELAEKQVESELEDPMRYLEDIYGDEAAAKAIEIAGIDIDAAAEEAVDTDGAEHFLARYDGNYWETPSGFVYWRSN